MISSLNWVAEAWQSRELWAAQGDDEPLRWHGRSRTWCYEPSCSHIVQPAEVAGIAAAVPPHTGDLGVVGGFSRRSCPRAG
jgi:hypothetical protein